MLKAWERFRLDITQFSIRNQYWNSFWFSVHLLESRLKLKALACPANHLQRSLSLASYIILRPVKGYINPHIWITFPVCQTKMLLSVWRNVSCSVLLFIRDSVPFSKLMSQPSHPHSVITCEWRLMQSSILLYEYIHCNAGAILLICLFSCINYKTMYIWDNISEVSFKVSQLKTSWRRISTNSQLASIS